MSRQVIAIGSDHAGYALKAALVEDLRALGYEPLDVGPSSESSVDYPDYAFAVATAVIGGKAASGVLICGTGIGMSIAANRHSGIRAALCTHGIMAKFAREHNDANILVLGSRIIGTEVAADCLRQFLTTPFSGGRHVARIAKLSNPRFEEPAL